MVELVSSKVSSQLICSSEFNIKAVVAVGEFLIINHIYDVLFLIYL
jgi:hypothetical protein